MARIGEKENEEYNDFSNSGRTVFSRRVLVGVLIFFLAINALVFVMYINIQNNLNMGVFDSVEMVNNHLMGKRVLYNSAIKTDPKDTSDLFYEVVKEDPSGKFKQGDLVKFNARFVEEVCIDGQVYMILNPDIIQFVIRKEDVKASLLKG